MADFSIEQPQSISSAFGTMTNTAYFAEMSFVEPRPKPVSKLWNICYALDGFTWLLFLLSYLSVSLFMFCLIHVTINKWTQVKMLE